MITRIWQGKKEWTDKIYFVGQFFIPENGTFKNVTRECETEGQASVELMSAINRVTPPSIPAASPR